MKGMFSRWIQKMTKKADIDKAQLLPEEIVRRGVNLALQQHVQSYPHSYFLRKGPRNIKFGRW